MLINTFQTPRLFEMVDEDEEVHVTFGANEAGFIWMDHISGKMWLTLIAQKKEDLEVNMEFMPEEVHAS